MLPRCLRRIALVGLMAAACSSPSSPTKNLPLRSGRHLLEMTGFGLSTDPQAPVCSPFATPPAGTRIMTFVDLAFVGEEWVARSVAGTLEIRIRATGEAFQGGLEVTGSAYGTAPDVAIPGVNVDHELDAIIDGDQDERAEISGTAYQAGRIIGRISGRIRFVDRQGRTGTCPVTTLLIGPY